MIDAIFACECRTNTPTMSEAIRPGEVFQCPNCKVVWGHLRPNGGGRAWIRVADHDVKFHRLLGREQ